jgi:peptidoglycan/LPS O-acetylase OafA/YrhL
MSHHLLPKFPAITVGEILADRNNGLTFVRLLLSILVLIAHSYSLGGFGEDKFFYVITRGQEGSGEVAVKSFMLLSGLLVTASFERQPLKLYFINRSLRIFPGYLCSILVIGFLFGPIMAVLSNVDLQTYFSTDRNGPWSYVLKNSLLAIRQTGILNLLDKNPFPHYVAGSHWTIWPEFQGYLVIAICGLLGLLKNFRFLLVPFTCLYVLSLVAIYNPNALSSLSDLRRIDLGLYLLSGVILYLNRSKILISQRGLLITILIFILCIILPIYDWIMPFFLGYLLLALTQLLPEYLKKIEKAGDFSYGIYLYHFPIQQIISLIGIQQFGFGYYFISTFLLTLPFSILSWHFVEKPANSLRYLFAPRS